MPKIGWTDLPTALREHLFERLRERKISAEDLYELNTGSQETHNSVCDTASAIR
jgi:hypothetical protein